MSDEQPLRQVVEPRLQPDVEGLVIVDIRMEVPRTVESFGLVVPTVTEEVRVSGFHPIESEPDTYVWDGETAEPRLSLVVPDNGLRGRSFDGTFVADGGEWAVIELPGFSRIVCGCRNCNHGVERVVRVGDRGVACDDGELIYLGPHQMMERRAGSQTFRLVVPEAANPATDPENILETLCRTSEGFRVGARYPLVFALALPASQDCFDELGRYSHGASFWVRADQPLSTPNTSWLHEYIHTRQAFECTDSVRWFLDASADYYGGLFAVQTGHVDREAFHEFVSCGRTESCDLTDPARWSSDTVPYVRGRSVLVGLDARLHRITNGERSLQTVLRLMNRWRGPVDHATLCDWVGTVGDASCAEWLDDCVRRGTDPAIVDAIDQVLP